MYTTTIKTENQHVGGNDYLRLELIFTHDIDDVDVVVNAKDVGVRVTDWGKLSWKYDIDDLLMVPGVVSMQIGDISFYIYNLLFGTGVLAEATDKRAKVKIYLNDDLLFSGKFVEDAIEYDDAHRVLSVQIASELDELNKIMVYDEDGNALNPLGYGAYDYINIQQMITDIYHKVNPNISLEFVHTWTFWAATDDIESAPEDGTEVFDVPFSALSHPVKDLFFDSAIGITSLGDALKKAAADWGAFTGLLHDEKAFFVKLFHYDPNNLQTIDKVNVKKSKYDKTVIEYVKTDIPEVGGFKYSTGNYIEIQDKGLVIEQPIIKFFCADMVPNDLGGDFATNIYADVTIGDVETALPVFRARDVYSGLVDWSNYGKLIADFWYKYRGDIKYCRVDTFELSGINYDLLKCFEYNGAIYQPISLTLNLADYSSKIEALYLGLAPKEV